MHEAEADAALYWVHDEPMVRYLGARAESPTFRPTLYRAEESRAELAKAEADPEAKRRSRISVLLANRACDQTLTVTPTLWAMLGILPADDVQVPHRHQSVALDLIIDCQPGCYTLVGKELDDQRPDHRPGAGGLEAGLGVRDAAGPLARPLQRVGRRGVPAADPGRGAADLPSDAGHPVRRPGLNARRRPAVGVAGGAFRS